MASHYTLRSVTTLHDFGGDLGRTLNIFLGLSQFHGYGSWLVCKVALSYDRGPVNGEIRHLCKINRVKLINYRFNFNILGCITKGKLSIQEINWIYKVDDGYSSLLIQDQADISCPKPSPTGFWLGCPRVSSVITGYPTPYLESFICLFLLFRVYMRGAAAGLHQSYHPHSFVKRCYMCCNVYLMFKGANIMYY